MSERELIKKVDSLCMETLAPSTYNAWQNVKTALYAGRTALNMNYKLSNRSKTNLTGVRPDLIELIEEAILDSPYDFGVPKYGGKRTQGDQAELYAIGRTTELDRKPVTYVDGVKKKSNHQEKKDGYGWAFDIYIYDHVEKRASWSVEKLTAVADHIKAKAAAKGIKLTWGGNWKMKDYPHFEIKL